MKFPYIKIVDLGQNNKHSPDGKLYFTSHGSTRPDGPVAWMSGDEVHMARVGKTKCDHLPTSTSFSCRMTLTAAYQLQRRMHTVYTH